MSELIQVFGLPRSGTAFISTMLNFNPRCIAFHELYEKHPEPDKAIARMLKAYDHVADCNTHGWLMKDYRPGNVRICIRRDTKSSVVATQRKLKLPLDERKWDYYATKLDEWAMESGAMVVYYEHLFKLDTLGAIWDFCFHGNDLFPMYKVNELMYLNVQMNDLSNIVSEEFQRKVKEDFG
jgi:hypothetical protein